MTTALPPRPAKFTAPSAGKLVARPRLFARLDTACRHPLVWIGATPGAGKTSLLASYLQQAGRPCIWIRLDADDARGDRFPELLARAIGSPRPAGRPAATGAQAATTRQALRAALERLPATAALVLDDYDESVAAWLDPWLALLADEVPAGVTVFVAAALEPPTVLARHRADERIATLGNDDLRLDADECAALLATREGMAPGRAADITRAAAGWAAGLGLLAGDASSAQWPLTEELAGYFAHHVFEPLDAETRNLLLHVAALPVFDAGMAAALSLVTTSRSRLERLVRAHHFVERRGDAGYAIHPLFRAWLRQRCDDELPPARHSNLLERTARLVEVSGDIALAVDLYRDAGAWVPMLNAMHAAVPRLLADGHADRVAGWLDALPTARSDAEPRTRLWHGLVRQATDRSGALQCFEVCWESFIAAGDFAGLVATVDAALQCYADPDTDLREAEPWIGRLATLARTTPTTLPPDIEARLAACGAVLLHHRLKHPLLARWAGRVSSLVRELDDRTLATRLVAFGAAYHFWRGEVVRAAALLENHDAAMPPAARALGSLLVHALNCGEPDADASPAVAPTPGLTEILEFLGVAAPADASTRARVRTYLQSGRLTEALLLQELVIDGARQLGRPLVLALALLEAGAIAARSRQPQRARTHLEEACLLAERLDSDLLRWNAGLWLAHSADALGDPRAGALVSSAIHVGARHGYTNCHPCWNAPAMAHLMRRALEQPVERDYVARLIRVRGLLPDSPEADEWPWAIRIHTLGRFSVVIDGAPLVFHGKAQRRPMDLLKAVIAFGGRDISLMALMETLWPDAEGDAGRKSFDVALLRLRRLLGHDDAIVLGDGKVSLNDKLCWVDLWSLERLLGSGDARQSVAQKARHARAALDRYRGPFMRLEDTQPWMLPPRERVANRLLRLVLDAGRGLEEASLWSQAAELYERTLDVHPQSDELYRRLMVCHTRDGNRAEARAVFERCRKLPSGTLGGNASQDLLAGYLRLMGTA